MKAIIVARVSTDEQKENSPDAQLFRMRNYCTNRTLTILEEFSFVESAYKTKRDEFDKIIETINAQKEKVAVCFDKVDRLSRNIFDKRVALLYEKAIENKIELHFVSDGQVIDANMSAGDKFAFGMKLGLSKYYSDAISDNVKRAFEQKRRNGEWTGAVRLGYLNVPLDVDKRTRKTITLDEDRWHLIREMFVMYATGNHSLETIRRAVTAKGLRSLKGYELSKSCVENIIKDSFYCGIAMSKYGNYPHIYPTIIGRDLFDECQRVRKSKKKNPYKPASRVYMFAGLLKCAKCGCAMSPEYHLKKSGKEYNLYSCTNSKGICKRIYNNENDLLEPILEVLKRFSNLSEEVKIALVDELNATSDMQNEYHRAQIGRITKEVEMITLKKERLLDERLENPESITKEIYDKKMFQLSDREQILTIELGEHAQADTDYKINISTILDITSRAEEIFESSEPYEKREFLNYLLQNSTVNEKTPCFTMRSPYNLVLDLTYHPNWLRE